MSNEILPQPSVRSIRSMTLLALREERYARKPFNQEEFDYYSNLFHESLDGMGMMMPHQFGPLIHQHMNSLTNALQCFSEFGKAYHLEKKIPAYYEGTAPVTDSKS